MTRSAAQTLNLSKLKTRLLKNNSTNIHFGVDLEAVFLLAIDIIFAGDIMDLENMLITIQQFKKELHACSFFHVFLQNPQVEILGVFCVCNPLFLQRLTHIK